MQAGPFQQIPSSLPAISPGKHSNGGSAHSCHSSSACKCVPEGREEMRERIVIKPHLDITGI